MTSIKIKNKIRDSINTNLKLIKDIISITFVGSFIDKKDFSGISDIDVIVIYKKLNKKKFVDCVNQLEKIDIQKCGLKNYSLKINSSFGPLKYDKPNLAVIHLMVYDQKLHKEHVIKSPFTCYDWERSNTNKGKSLKEIFPVGTLQLIDFTESRRSLNNYLEDINRGIISYRDYNFDQKSIREIKKNFILDERHKSEFSYHIIRNLMLNYVKFYNRENIYYSDIELMEVLKKHSEYFNNYNIFKTLSEAKLKEKKAFPKNSLFEAKKFLNSFQVMIKKKWENANKIIFIRHFKTNLNDKTYLGQSRNPGIDDFKKIELMKNLNREVRIISSPMRRCLETCKKLFGDKNIIINDYLNEFNYGLAEGLSYEELRLIYPEIIEQWSLNKDPKFPNGESTKDVSKRVTQFLENLKDYFSLNKDMTTYVVSHNGFLRCLVGIFLNIEKKHWYKINIPYGLEIEFLFNNDHFYPNIKRVDLSNILTDVGNVEI